MSPVRHVVVLAGCRPRPLASYLKAVGLHRVVAEQADPGATSAWGEGGIHLCSTLDEAGLRRFLDEEYRPTPVISPWNGGSGFHPGDNTSGIGPIAASTDPRFAPYAETIAVARRGMAELRIGKESKERKPELVEWLRAELPEAALAWLDAAVLLGSEGLKYPPLLGTGGNDGRLDFSNNFMQRLVALRDAAPALRRRWLDHALFDRPVPRLVDAAVGQFQPATAGGYNTGFGFEGDARVNPWDFVLLLEGSLAFAAAGVRRLEGGGATELAFPFMVRSAAAGYTSAAAVDEAETRNELWLPLWSAPSTWRELRQLFGEGRALVGSGKARRPVGTALDFARALGELGTDRGVSAFERYGFHVRNGLAYLAVPLGRWTTRRNEAMSGLAAVDSWLERFRQKTADATAPASLRRIRKRLDEAVLALCAEDSWERRAELLLVLGQADAALARSLKWAVGEGVRPAPGLDASWLPPPEVAGPEERLAVVLAAQELRRHAAPLDPKGSPWAPAWAERPGPEVVWGGESLLADLGALARRREIERSQAPSGASGAPGPVGAELGDIAAFLAGEVDDERLAGLARAFALVHPGALRALPGGASPGPLPPLYPFLALAHDPRAIPLPGGGEVDHPPVPALLRRALVGDAEGASRLALRRLRASGLPARSFDRRRPGSRDVGVVETAVVTRRVAAALAFPLSGAARRELASQTLVSPDHTLEPA